MYIYVICSVRKQNEREKTIGADYVAALELEGHRVFYPPRGDAPQDSKTGYEIVETELQAIKECDEVHVLWNVESKGSHMDLGMAYALNKKIKLVHAFQEDNEGKSYEKVMRIYGRNYDGKSNTN